MTRLRFWGLSARRQRVSRLGPQGSMRVVAGALAVALAAALSACASSSSATRFHTLQAVAATAPVSSYAGPPLQVRSVAVPAALDRNELLRDVGAGQFEVRDFDHWAAPLPQLARSALSEDLALRLKPGQLVFPGASWPAAGAELSIDIQSFRVRDGSATMQLSWSLRPRMRSGTGAETPTASASMAIPAAQGAQLQLRLPAGDGAGALSQAFAALLAQAADRIVETLGEQRSVVRP
ncbi:MAG: ABC-type transport auxiliary lipoprotein family protein [Rubrivivax sp.]